MDSLLGPAYTSPYLSVKLTKSALLIYIYISVSVCFGTIVPGSFCFCFRLRFSLM